VNFLTDYFIVFDLETTGLYPRRGCRVIEIGAVALKDGIPVREFQSLLSPPVVLPQEAKEINHITEEMLEEAPKPGEVIPTFREFIGDATLVAHNAKFDMAFLRAEFERLGLRLINHFHCTMEMSRRLYPGLPNYRLETVARHVLGHVPEDVRLHRALDDARITARIWMEMVKR
jgi:DNA polymerase-3 subunit epsilon